MVAFHVAMKIHCRQSTFIKWVSLIELTKMWPNFHWISRTEMFLRVERNLKFINFPILRLAYYDIFYGKWKISVFTITFLIKCIVLGINLSGISTHWFYFYFLHYNATMWNGKVSNEKRNNFLCKCFRYSKGNYNCPSI